MLSRIHRRVGLRGSWALREGWAGADDGTGMVELVNGLGELGKR